MAKMNLKHYYNATGITAVRAGLYKKQQKLKLGFLRKHSQTQGTCAIRSSFSSSKEQLHRYNKPSQTEGMTPVESICILLSHSE